MLLVSVKPAHVPVFFNFDYLYYRFVDKKYFNTLPVPVFSLIFEVWLRITFCVENQSEKWEFPSCKTCIVLTGGIAPL